MRHTGAAEHPVIGPMKCAYARRFMPPRSMRGLPDRGDAGSCGGGCTFCHCSNRARLEVTPSPAAAAKPLVPLPSAELTLGELRLKRPNREALQRTRAVCFSATAAGTGPVVIDHVGPCMHQEGTSQDMIWGCKGASLICFLTGWRDTSRSCAAQSGSSKVLCRV